MRCNKEKPVFTCFLVVSTVEILGSQDDHTQSLGVRIVANGQVHTATALSHLEGGLPW